MARDSHQHDLPFADAEAKAAEQANDLRTALALVGCDLQLRVFVEMVHQADLRGTKLRKSYRELASRPYGLCCHPATAQRTVAQALHHRLITSKPHVDGAGAQSANEYGVDWDGIGRILRREPRTAGANGRAADGRQEMISPAPAGLGSWPVQFAQPPNQIAHPPTQFAYPGVQFAQANKSYLLNNSSHTSNSGTGSGSGTGTGVISERFRQVPELEAAIDRELEPLPIGWMVYGGAFSREHFFEAHLRSTLAMVTWFRRQLSIDWPFTSNRQADLLLVIAAAECCVNAPQRDVRVSRIAKFCNQVGHGQWHRFLSSIPAAAARLDKFVQQLSSRGLDLNWPDGAIANQTQESEAVR